MEGGYDLEALASSALTHVEVLAAGYPVLPEGPYVHKNEHDHFKDGDDEGAALHGGNEAAALAAYIAGLDL